MPAVALLPEQAGVAYDDPSHRYHVYSASRGRWLAVDSTSQVLSISGAKSFDPTHWRRSLIQRHGLRPHEADVYMKRHRNHRADVGTELHGLIRAELLGGNFHPHHAESLMLLAVWRREFLPSIDAVIACEAPLVSLPYFFSGTPDLIARVDGRWLLLDWKTKVSAEKAMSDPGWLLQLAGYDILAEHCHGLRLDGAMNLIVWPEGTMEVQYNRADVNQARGRFVAALLAHHAIRAEGGCADHAAAYEHFQRLVGPLDAAPTMGAQ